jgi:predicted MFS family arabinose efflux permease
MAMSAGNVVCVTLGGVLPQRFGGLRRPWIMLGASSVVAASACLLLGTWLKAPGWVFVLGYLLLSGSAFATPSNLTTIKVVSRPEAVAIAISLSNGLSYLGSGVIGQIGGVILASFRGEASETPSGIVYPHAAYLALSGFLAVLSLVNFYFASRVPETGKAR